MQVKDRMANNVDYVRKLITSVFFCCCCCCCFFFFFFFFFLFCFIWIDNVCKGIKVRIFFYFIYLFFFFVCAVESVIIRLDITICAFQNQSRVYRFYFHLLVIIYLFMVEFGRQSRQLIYC